VSAPAGAARVVGVGETRYAKWGGITGTSEYQLAVEAVLAAIADAGMTPDDVDVVQAYENFTGGTVMALVEHGFCTPETADQVLTFENLIAPNGGLPLNTSGGNLAECYTHGLELHVEAVRQLRGESTNQVPGARVALVASGPMVTPATDALYGTADTL